jgi:hypothetical protein
MEEEMEPQNPKFTFSNAYTMVGSKFSIETT